MSSDVNILVTNKQCKLSHWSGEQWITSASANKVLTCSQFILLSIYYKINTSKGALCNISFRFTINSNLSSLISNKFNILSFDTDDDTLLSLMTSKYKKIGIIRNMASKYLFSLDLILVPKRLLHTALKLWLSRSLIQLGLATQRPTKECTVPQPQNQVRRDNCER
jgi:hypothetical protein